MLHITVTETPAPPIRPLHGMNLAAPITNAALCELVSGELAALNVPITRMHDCPLNNPGRDLVDIHCVFPVFEADATQPENYYFAETDDYFANALSYGTTIMYRLGVSIEHGKNKYRTRIPANFTHWADICTGIIRHYNENWASGREWNIEYWEIWNEADTELDMLWQGSWEEFIAFYITVAKILKSRFPQLKIGGPSMAKLHGGKDNAARRFLARCREENAPLDFFTYHQYSDKPERIIAGPVQARALLDEFGFTACEIHLAEWHYHPGWGSDCHPERARKINALFTGSDAAAYLLAALIGWQAGPLTMAEFYTGSTGRAYALFDDQGLPTAQYYAVAWFNALCRCPEALSVDVEGDAWALAARDGARLVVAAACFKTVQDELEFTLPIAAPDPARLTVTMLDFDGVPHVLTREVRWAGNRVTIEKVTGSAMLKLEYC